MAASLSAAPVSAPVVKAAVVVTPSTPAKKLNPIKLKQLEDRLAFVEAEMPRLEGEIAAGEAELGMYRSAEESQRLAAGLDKMRMDHAALMVEWEGLTMQLEEAG